MQLRIAVDIKDGIYVHATGGDRARYRPPAWVQGERLAPRQALDAIRRRFGADRFYLADLDAIAGASASVLTRYQGLSVDAWLDLGIKSPAEWLAAAQALESPLILATETSRQQEWGRMVRLLRYDDVVSLDIRQGQVIFRDGLVDVANLDHYLSAVHPSSRVLALDLDRVGSGRGPDWPLIHHLRRCHPRIWIGGGVRHQSDLAYAQTLGIEGAVIATALFNGHVALPSQDRELWPRMAETEHESGA
jgi:phosphoribosylformimino-5-aminoimidazole carboxamide ribotide isomerase